jgi:TonB family protein
MPQRPASRRHSSGDFEANPEEGSGAARDAALSLSQYLTALTPYSDGSVSAGVALDLVLNDIVKRACLATNASAGAIALADKDEMVCRATTGENAPDLGMRLDTSHGLSGACVTTKLWQRCNDTENDSRVNAAVCRHLGVRSILVVPILNANELAGIIEMFSVRPHAFSDRETETLQTFSQEVLENLQGAAEAQTAPLVQAKGAESVGNLPEFMTMTPVANETDVSSVSTQTPQARSSKDFSTTILLACVVILALAVGWMMGRSEWRHGGKTAPANKQFAERAEQTGIESSGGSDQTGNQSPSVSTTQPKITGAGMADGGLIVTRDGKVIFRTPPQPVGHPVGHEAETNEAAKPAMRLSPDVAERYVINRVEPEYPEQARRDQVQGSVVLDTLVGADGSVQKITSVSGNPELLPAATHAVQQWRFRPFLDNGQPQQFITQITVVFRLP